ncbi:DUF6710 family protein [Lactobacillus sp. PSON]|uniref:DUF6710 family protein n=1 Tax=Lactobacillus sp. PSON TaxID=3455454 RepID=UPI004042CDCC
MFGKKSKEIYNLKLELENIKKQVPFNYPSKLVKTIDYKSYDLNTNYNMGGGLMYLQKIICNSIIYNDFAYSVIRNPHSAPKLEISNFIPRNNNYIYYNIFDKPIYLTTENTPFITCPWSNKKIINNIYKLGLDANNKFAATTDNINNTYIYPLGIVIVNNGNHSQFSALLKNELDKIKINSVYNISFELDNQKDINFRDFYAPKNNLIYDKWYSLMIIGTYLKNTEDCFPSKILSLIKNNRNS